MKDFDKFAKQISDKDGYELYFLETLIKKYPDFYEAYFPLADLYTRSGHYKKGLALDLKLSKIYPDDESVWYNLACSLSLCKKIDDALDALEKSVKLGWNDVQFMISDPDLDNIKLSYRYTALINYLSAKNKA